MAGEDPNCREVVCTAAGPLGLKFSGKPPCEYLEITAVTEGSWAASVNLQVGDFILEVNGEDVEAMAEARLPELLKSRPLRLYIDPVDEVPPTAAPPKAAPPKVAAAAPPPAAAPKAPAPGEDPNCREVVAGPEVVQLGLKFNGKPPCTELEITNVTPGSWAASVNLQAGDFIIEVNGEDTEQLQEDRFKQHMKGRPLRLYIDPVDEVPPPAPVAKAAAPPPAPAPAPAKAAAAPPPRTDVDPNCREVVAAEGVAALGLKFDGTPPCSELEITSVAPGSWGASVNLQVGDFIVEVNGQDVQTLTEETLKTMLKARPVRLYIDPVDEEPPVPAAPKAVAPKAQSPTPKPGEDPNCREVVAPVGTGPLGMKFSGTPPCGELEITGVTEGSWAASQGLQVGDFIIEVNGVSMQELTPDTMKGMLKDRPVRLYIDPVDEPPPSAAAPAAPAAAPAKASQPASAPAPPPAAPPPSQPKDNNNNTNNKNKDPNCREVVAGEGVGPLGLKFEGTPPCKELEITAVADGSWGASVNLQVGDFIVEVNGKDMQTLTQDSLRAMLKSRPVTLFIDPVDEEPSAAVEGITKPMPQQGKEKIIETKVESPQARMRGLTMEHLDSSFSPRLSRLGAPYCWRSWEQNTVLARPSPLVSTWMLEEKAKVSPAAAAWALRERQRGRLVR